MLFFLNQCLCHGVIFGIPCCMKGERFINRGGGGTGYGGCRRDYLTQNDSELQALYGINR